MKNVLQHTLMGAAALCAVTAFAGEETEVPATACTFNGFPQSEATYCEIDGEPFPIFKNPKDGGFKKSQYGCCSVHRAINGSLAYLDGYTWEEATNDDRNELKTVFKDGKLVKEQNLSEIRNVLHGGKF